MPAWRRTRSAQSGCGAGEACGAHQPACASQRAIAELDPEEALAIDRAGQPEAFRQLAGEAEALVIGRVADEQHGACGRAGGARSARRASCAPPRPFARTQPSTASGPSSIAAGQGRRDRPQAHGGDDATALLARRGETSAGRRPSRRRSHVFCEPRSAGRRQRRRRSLFAGDIGCASGAKWRSRCANRRSWPCSFPVRPGRRFESKGFGKLGPRQHPARDAGAGSTRRGGFRPKPEGPPSERRAQRRSCVLRSRRTAAAGSR